MQPKTWAWRSIERRVRLTSIWSQSVHQQLRADLVQGPAGPALELALAKVSTGSVDAPLEGSLRLVPKDQVGDGGEAVVSELVSVELLVRRRLPVVGAAEGVDVRRISHHEAIAAAVLRSYGVDLFGMRPLDRGSFDVHWHRPRRCARFEIKSSEHPWSTVGDELVCDGGDARVPGSVRNDLLGRFEAENGRNPLWSHLGNGRSSKSEDNVRVASLVLSRVDGSKRPGAMLFFKSCLDWIQVEVDTWFGRRSQWEWEGDEAIGTALGLVTEGKGRVVLGNAVDTSGPVALVQGESSQLKGR